MPQLPPQPLLPQTLNEQSGVQHAPRWHTLPPPQPQSVAQLAQVSLPLQLPSPQPEQVPLVQVNVPEQVPQDPPQPLGPQFLPEQLGAQHASW